MCSVAAATERPSAAAKSAAAIAGRERQGGGGGYGDDVCYGQEGIRAELRAGKTNQGSHITGSNNR